MFFIVIIKLKVLEKCKVLNMYVYYYINLCNYSDMLIGIYEWYNV